MEEFCPSCGSWTSDWVEQLGWCRSCAEEHLPGNLKLCDKCNKAFIGESRSCPACKLEQWFAANADQLEELLAQGHSITSARKEIWREHRPTCLSCGAVLKNAPRNSLFCRNKNMCTKLRRRYRTIRENYIKAGRDSNTATQLATTQIIAEIHRRHDERISTTSTG